MLFLVACDTAATPPTSVVVAAARGDAATSIRAIRAAVQARNLGVAAELASRAEAEFPADPQIHLLRAEIEAELGNAGDSARAFALALDNKLPDPAHALDSAVFDRVRAGAAFGMVRSRLDELRVAEGGARSHRSRIVSRVRAGDVEILETEDGATVRAGDVRLDDLD